MKKTENYFGSAEPISNWKKLIITMKISVFFFFCGLINLVAGPGYSQNTKISLDMKDATVEQVLNKIEDESEFYFLFNQKLIDVNRKVDVTADNKPIRDILQDIFGNNVKVIVSDRQVVLSPANYAESLTDMIQQAGIKGKVTDATSGQPLAGVNVVIKGTTQGAITDINGEYSFPDIQPNATIIFSFIGYNTVEMPVSGKSIMDIALSTNTLSLNDVIVTAYGTTKRAAITGSVSVISANTLSLNKATNINAGLQGLIPGVQVAAQSGQPGADQTILVRGLGSFTASSAPLYVVDGVPFDLGPNSINFSDIESISVLKDASASSLYGARAANGVILITTKKGKTDKTRVEAYSIVGTSELSVPFPKKDNINKQWENVWQGLYNDATDFLNMNDADARQYAVDNVTGAFYDPMPFKLPDGTTRQYHSGWNTDYPIGLDGKVKSDAKRLWDFDSYATFFKRRLKQDHGVTISGSMNEKNKYYMSVSYMDDKGAYVGDNYSRLTGKIALDTKVAKWLDMSNSVLLTSSNNANHPFDVRPFRTLSRENTYYIYDYSTGTYFSRPDIPGQLAIDNTSYTGRIAWGGYAPTLYLYDFLADRIQNLQTNTSLTATLMKGLTFRTTYSYQLFNEVLQHNTPPDDNQFLDQPDWGTIIRSNTNAGTNYFNNVLTYDNSFGGDHHLNFLIGHEYYDYKVSRFYADRSGLALPFFNDLDQAIDYPNVSSGTDTYKLLSFFGKVQYDFRNKYFINASYRMDGSSRFSTDKRWGSFFSLGGAWIVSSEEFMKSTSGWLTNLKIKASYGELGNDNVGSYYTYQSFYGNGGTYYGNLGIATSQLANPNLKWETNISLNGGIEFTLFNRLSGTIDLFQRTSKDLLMNAPLPLSSGNSSILRNIGTLKNTGYELELNYTAISQKNLILTIHGNASHYTNKITSLPYGSFESQTDLMGHGGVAYYKWTKGGSIYDIYCSDWADVNPQDGRNEWWLYTFKSNGDISEKTKTEVFTQVNNVEQRIRKYSALPKVFGSYGLNLQYKGFDLEVMFYYSMGGWIYDYNRAESSVLRQCWSTYSVLDKSWKKPGDITNIAKIYEYYSNSAYSRQNIGSSLWMDKNNFTRIKNLVIGYSLPTSLSERLKIEKLRVYFKGENLFTTGYCQKWGTDPESGGLWGQNLSGLTYFPRRTYNLGINITF